MHTSLQSEIRNTFVQLEFVSKQDGNNTNTASSRNHKQQPRRLGNICWTIMSLQKIIKKRTFSFS